MDSSKAAERHARMSKAQTPDELIGQLVHDADDIGELVICIGYNDGPVITYNTAMTQAELCWFLRKMDHDGTAAMFEHPPRPTLERDGGS